MACRSGIQRVLAHSRDVRKNASSVSRNSLSPCRSVATTSAVQSVISEELSKARGWKQSNDDDLSSHLVRTLAGAAKSSSSRDSDERDEGSSRLRFSNWDTNLNSMKMRRRAQEEREPEYYDATRHFLGISSAQLATSASSGSFSGRSFGRFGLASGTGACNGVWGVSTTRSFSAAPAAAESAQIPVDGQQLESLQGGLLDVSDAVATLPSPGALSEVAVAAADSSVPVAFVQYCIDGVHFSTGLPWWLSIVATTVAIRIIVLPIIVYQMRATARLTLMRPELEKLTNKIKDSGYDPKVVEDNQIRMKALFQKYKTSPLSPILGAFVQAPIFMCFFFGIRNMAEKMESFKEGGALWFTDLSTPDSFFILPVLSGAFFLLTVELGATDGMEGQPMMAKMKMFFRGLSVLLVPLTASFPKALFCYWLTANVFSIFQSVALKRPAVKASLGIPDVSHLAKPADVPVAPVLTFSQPPRLKGDKAASSKQQRP